MIKEVMGLFFVYNSERGGVLNVYNIRSDDYGNIEFLVYDRKAEEWVYVPSSECRPA